jgi:hypothetical protein
VRLGYLVFAGSLPGWPCSPAASERARGTARGAPRGPGAAPGQPLWAAVGPVRPVPAAGQPVKQLQRGRVWPRRSQESAGSARRRRTARNSRGPKPGSTGRDGQATADDDELELEVHQRALRQMRHRVHRSDAARRPTLTPPPRRPTRQLRTLGLGSRVRARRVLTRQGAPSVNTPAGERVSRAGAR